MRLVADIETNGLYHKATTIHCICAIDLDTDEQYEFGPNDIVDGLTLLSKATLIVGHNWAGYDDPVLRKLTDGFKFTNNIHDTLAMSRMLFLSTLRDKDVKRKDFPKNLIGAHSLESWGHRLGMLKDDFGKTTDWNHFSPAMLDYCMQDVMVCKELYKRLQVPIERLNPTPVDAFATESTVSNILFKSHINGIGFNESAAANLYSKLLGEREKLRQELQEIFKPEAVSMGIFVPKRDNKRLGYAEGCECSKIKIVEFNPGSDMQIASRLQKEWNWKPEIFTDKGQVKVDESVLSTLPYPPAKALMQYKLVDKRIGAIAEGSQAWLKVSESGKIHGKTFATGARTGRQSHSSPNIGQIPNNHSPYGSECRELFVPTRPNWWFMDTDLSSIELRLLAHRLAPYDNGDFASIVSEGDPHALFQSFTGIQNRDLQKSFTFAMIYGAGNYKLGTVVAKDQDKILTDRQTTALGTEARQSIFQKMPALPKLLEACARANQRGWVRLIDGRYAKSVSEHSAINTLIQGDGSVILKHWMVELWNLLQQHVHPDQFGWVATVHDEILLEAPTELIATDLGNLAEEAIQTTAKKLEVRCKLSSEFNVGRTWKEVH